MLTQTFRVDSREGRMFARDAGALDRRVFERAARDYLDPDDQMREPALRRALSTTRVMVDGHFGVDPREALHVYVQTPQGPLFACVIVPEALVEMMLAETPAVFETFTFQVSSGLRVSRAAAVAAIESWTERNFPDCQVPAFSFLRWVDEHAFLHLEVAFIHVAVPAPSGKRTNVAPLWQSASRFAENVNALRSPLRQPTALPSTLVQQLPANRLAALHP